MSDGELGAVFKGLANDAAQAGEDIGESIAQFTIRPGECRYLV
jgi:hypothetical protein